MREGWRRLLGRDAWLWLWLPIALVTAAHYATPPHYHTLHGIYRRLYYIPIIIGAVRFGWPGAISASLLSSCAYLPHALGWTAHHDPGTPVEKSLEILLYVTVGAVTGLLAHRERRERERQEATAKRLAGALDEVREMERQLLRSERLQALGELTAGLAHEIRNPLASMKGATDIIADEIPASSPRWPMLDIVRREIERLNTLLERFLSFARPTAQATTPVSLAQVVEKVVALIEPRAAKAGTRIICRFDPSTPTVPADAAGIEQIVFNLIINAVQAMPGGGAVDVAVELGLKGRRAYAIIRVDDNGPGVPHEIREQVFNPFFTTKSDGSGLGLSIAARIADAHGGFLELDDSPRGGASFRVYLPVDAAPDPPMAGGLFRHDRT